MKGGSVTFLGAGPGDPDLLTLKGQRRLKTADVILYDSLAHPSLLQWAKKSANLIHVGKRKGAHSQTQDSINQTMLEHAQAGQHVLRLKGGDPVVFGRLGEEMAYLKQHNIPYEVIPGVSAAIAGPIYAGIPVTHRERSRSFAVVTGTLKTGGPIDKKSLPSADTLVILMPMTHLETLVQMLSTHHKFTKNTPAALIENATRANQRVAIATLETLIDARQNQNINAPAMLVVGDIAEWAHDYTWTQQFPLFGQRIFILRPTHQASNLSEKLNDLGAEVCIYPMIEIAPEPSKDKAALRQDLRTVSDIIFTSSNAVAQFFVTLQNQGLDARSLAQKHILSVGPKTAEALKQYGIIADKIAQSHHALGVLDCLDANLSQKTVLLPTSKSAKQQLETALKERGATVIRHNLYAPNPAEIRRDIPIKNRDWVVFTSPSTVKHFYAHNSDAQNKITAFAIGKTTEAALLSQGAKQVVTSQNATSDAMIQAMLQEKNHV